MKTPLAACLLLAFPYAANVASAQCSTDKLAAHDTTFGAGLGRAVDLSAGRVLVGAPGESTAQLFSAGAAYVFEQGLPSAKLVADDAGEKDLFGRAVALSGDTALVATGPGPKGSPGAAYVFERNALVWSQTAKLSGGGFLGSFGSSTSVAGDTIAVGAAGNILPLPFSGSVELFERTVNGWIPSATLKASAAVFAADEFGRSVATTGDRVLVGASHFGSGIYGAPGEGAAHVFDRVDPGTPGDPLDDTWTLTATLHASDGAVGDLFGWSVSLSGDTAFVGSFADDDAGASSGSVHVFELGPSGWVQVAKLTASNASAGDEFGRSVAVDGTTALIGAPASDRAGVDSGSLYRFERSASGWAEVHEHAPSDASAADSYGTAVALDGDAAAAGAPGDDGVAVDTGAAYTLSISETACPLLLAAPGAVSIASGGEQSFVLTADPSRAGLVYLLLGSASGTTPGIPHDGFVVPLQFDSYFLHSLTAPNAPPFVGTLGVLDPDGDAQAALVVPPGLSPALAGAVLHHAWVGLDPAIQSIAVVSSAKPLVLAP